MCQYSADDGVPGAWHQVHLGSFATGGAGLIFAEASGVVAEGRISTKCPGLWNDVQVEAWGRITLSDLRLGNMTVHLEAEGQTAKARGLPEDWQLVVPSG